MSFMEVFVHSKIGSSLLYYKNRSYYRSIEEKYYNNYDYNLLNIEQIIHEAAEYTKTLKINNCDYRFCLSQEEACLYSSVYACLIQALDHDLIIDEKKQWKEYFDGFQDDSGLFNDPRNMTSKYMDGDNWGARHLLPHILIAYDRIGELPRKEFSFVIPFCNPDYVIKWINQLDWRNSWATSNQVMNIGIALLYARDFMGMNSQKGIDVLEEWLINNMKNGLPDWHKGILMTRAAKYDSIRGTYHIIPILLYDGHRFSFSELYNNQICRLQNKWGGFNSSIISTACDDIDAVDPLIRLEYNTGMKSKRTNDVIKRNINNILFNRNDDGGFCFSRSKNGFKFGDCSILKSNPNESNLFGTWFRLVCLEEIGDYLGLHQMKGSRVPGYEFDLN